jgi:hypothetical protein
MYLTKISGKVSPFQTGSYCPLKVSHSNRTKAEKYSVTHRIQAATQNKTSMSSPRGVGDSNTEFLARVRYGGDLTPVPLL